MSNYHALAFQIQEKRNYLSQQYYSSQQITGTGLEKIHPPIVTQNIANYVFHHPNKKHSSSSLTFKIVLFTLSVGHVACSHSHTCCAAWSHLQSSQHSHILQRKCNFLEK